MCRGLDVMRLRLAIPVACVTGCPAATSPPREPSVATSTPSANSKPTAPPDPWAGPIVWTRAPLACAKIAKFAKPHPGPHWKSFATGTTATLSAVSVGVSRGDDVIAVGDAGTVIVSRDRGGTFERCTIGRDERLREVWASSADDAWIVGTRWLHRIEAGSVATAALELDDAPDLEASIVAASSHEVWLSIGGTVRHTKDNGTTWTTPFKSDPFASRCVDALTGTPDALWTACDFSTWKSVDGAITWQGGGWPGVTEERQHIHSAFGEVWVVGQESRRIGHSLNEGVTWSAESLGSPSTNRRMWGVWSGGHGWAWVMADGLWVRPGKLPWVRDLPASVSVRLGGAGAKDVWAVGENGLLLHRL